MPNAIKDYRAKLIRASQLEKSDPEFAKAKQRLQDAKVAALKHKEETDRPAYAVLAASEKTYRAAIRQAEEEFNKQYPDLSKTV